MSSTFALHSSTFSQPPFDGSLCMPAIIDWQAAHSPKHPLFAFEEAPGSLRSILWEEAIQGIHRATEHIRRAIDLRPGSTEKSVIAILSSSDTITYTTFFLGAMRTGHTVFFISPRNSPAAVSALLAQTNTRHIFVSADKSNQDLISAAMMSSSGGLSVTQHHIPVFEDLYPSVGVDPSFVPSPLPDFDMKDYAIIIHSSGSTAFPKLIYLKHEAFISCKDVTHMAKPNLADCVWSFHAMPMLHTMGIIGVNLAIGCGITIAAFKPQNPAIVPNPENVIAQALATQCDYILITPTFVETWSQNAKQVESLVQLKGVLFGGGSLSKESGDHLASRGVNMYNVYGLTETMLVGNLLQSQPGMDWEYFEVCQARKAHLVDHGNDELELVILATDTYIPSVINTNVDGQDGFATKDLVRPHPTKKGFYRIVGRTDDQIIHSTGEKTNPSPLEKILDTDPLVSDVVMFGRGRFYCGALVQPIGQAAFDPKDMKKLAEFRSLIWPSVEKMNTFAPFHSRLFKEMIIVASPSKPFTYTGKGTIRRQAIIREYAEEIDGAYAAVDESSQDGISGPSAWVPAIVKEFVRKVVENTMETKGKLVSDDGDLFESGMDSLQATWIRNSILRVLRESQPSIARSLSPTFVYDYPSISRLANFLCSTVNGVSEEPIDRMEAKRQELRALVDKYSQSFPTFKGGHMKATERASGSVVLLTGSTGSLGSNILAKLIGNANVKRVYTMSRPSPDGTSPKDKHVKAFERESLESTLLDDEKVVYLEGDAAHADFGVSGQRYKEMQSSVTHIIHNGWRVNFNVAVSSFESNIRSVRNFIDFSLGGTGSTPARIIFISSFGVFLGCREKKIGPEGHLVQPDSAIGTGYAESKWVSEQILQRASKATPLSSTIARCGQMTGGPSGAWNEHEWFPSLVKSSITLGKLPEAEGVATWISAVDAGGAVVDMLDANEEEVLHIVHPHPVAWSSLISSFSKVLGVRSVPFNEWLSTLESAAKSVPTDAAAVESANRSNPAIRLLPFYRGFDASMPDESSEAMGFARLACERAMAVSPSMQNADVLGERDVMRWVAFWKKSGFLQV